MKLLVDIVSLLLTDVPDACVYLVPVPSMVVVVVLVRRILDVTMITSWQWPLNNLNKESSRPRVDQWSW